MGARKYHARQGEPAMTTKLNQIIAVEKSVKAKAHSEITEEHQQW
jgi:hypothetical protein